MINKTINYTNLMSNLPGFTCYAEGLRTPELAGNEGIYLQSWDGPITIVLRSDNPTQKEVDNFKNTPGELRFWEHEGVIFTMLKLNGMWLDFPFVPLVPPHLIGMSDVDDGMGYMLNLILCDTTGLVYGLRVIGLSTFFSKGWKQALEDSVRKDGVSRYYEVFPPVYSEYTPKQLAEKARYYNKFGYHSAA